MSEFKFPDVGEGITEGEIVKWHVKEGDIVKEHDVIVDIETDKAVVNIPSPYSGKVIKIWYKEGDTIKVGETLVTIGEGKVTKSTKTIKTIKAVTKKPQKGLSVVGVLPEAEEVKAKDKIPLAPVKVTAQKVSVLTTPVVRRLARDLNIDITKIKGSGIAGRITEEDVRKSAKSNAPATKSKEIKVTKKYDFYGYIDRIPLRGIRKATAKRMVESAFSIPHVTHMDEADVSELWNIREKEKIKAQKKKIHLTFLPFIVKAVINALKKYPYLNASLDVEHEEIILKKYYNIGIAVDTGEGLLVPVIKEAAEKGLFEIAKEIEEFADKALKRKLDLADLKGNSFTITNIGVIGGKFGTPIINLPDVGILAIGKIYDKPVAINNKVVIRKVLPLSLSFDHRVLDGAYAARFTNLVKEQLENPKELMKN